MNLNRDFSQFLAEQQAVIENGRAEALADKTSLERMRLTAIRQGRTQDAADIQKFLSAALKERNFFRDASHIVAESQNHGIARVSNWLRGLRSQPTPSNFEKVEGMISPQKPFACFEGVLQPSEEKGPARLVGPFFAAVAANFSEAVDVKQGHLVCLFTQAANPQATPAQVELRIWSLDRFVENFRGKTYEFSSLAVPPESNETILSLHRGSVSQLFQIAVENMVRASLSRNPPQKVAERFIKLLEEYGDINQPSSDLA